MSQARTRDRGARHAERRIRAGITTRTRAMIAVPAVVAAVGSSIAMSQPASAAPSADRVLSAIVQCESNGNPRVVNEIGAGGLFQFLPPTWRGVGGSGLPQNASAEEQWKRARILYAQQGTGPWYASKHCWAGKIG
ncbi:transglycosylase family protein [Candidatus Protofrankia californiensis]|uniref:transglycosylase family protein n=1 Tax=Candidatus Protofrankia californiensis TaxID=1839754 RepID=UPI001041B940|nr:transglycosylase family protein [Candidatus Protofrankia californiensis]